MTRRRLAAALALAPLLALAAVAPAVAADAGSGATIDHVERQGDTLQLLVSVPGTAPVQLDQVTATVAGASATASAQQASGSGQVTRTTVLAIDTSDSMRGARIRAAKTAAQTYLTTVPADVRVGIVTFADRVETVLQPTTDRTAARQALGNLHLALHTSLYAGVAAAVQATGTEGQRDVLLLSDGKDTTRASLSALVSSVKKSGAKVDAVSLSQRDTSNPALQQIAAAGGGTVLSAQDTKQLSAAYAAEAKVLARQVLVSVTVPATQHATDASVALSLPAGGTTYDASAFVHVRDAAKAPVKAPPAPQPVAAGGMALPQPVMLGAVIAVGLAVIALVVLLLGSGSGPRKPGIEEQIASYGVTAKPRGRRSRDVAPTSLGDQAKDVAARALASNESVQAKVEARLEAAGMALKPAEWVLLHAGIALGAGVLGALLGGGSPVLIVLFLAFGAVGPWLYLGIKRSRRTAAFDEHLADTLQLLAGSLSAGLSLAQSLDTITREGAEPVASEFRRVIVESRLGVELEDAMEGVATRMESKDFAWVVMAIRIQRQVGGNLSELLLTVAATLRERAYLRRHVKALSAEGRLSCWVLGGLPPVFLAYLAVSRPSYVQPLFTTPIGLLMCGAMVVLLGVGIFWMSKVAKVEL
ncbi:MAG: type II secretion system F family protein [Marmoricola sp.]